MLFYRTMTVDKDNKKVLAVLALCSPELKLAWDNFHEVLLVDATYKVNFDDYALLNVLTIGQHGHGYPIGQAFVAGENVGTYRSALTDIVGLLGGTYNDARILLADKDWAQLAMFNIVMQKAKIYLCSGMLTNPCGRQLES